MSPTCCSISRFQSHEVMNTTSYIQQLHEIWLNRAKSRCLLGNGSSGDEIFISAISFAKTKGLDVPSNLNQHEEAECDEDLATNCHDFDEDVCVAKLSGARPPLVWTMKLAISVASMKLHRAFWNFTNAGMMAETGLDSKVYSGSLLSDSF